MINTLLVLLVVVALLIPALCSITEDTMRHSHKTPHPGDLSHHRRKAKPY